MRAIQHRASGVTVVVSIAALALTIAAGPAAGSSARPAATQLSPKVLRVVPTGFSVDASPTTVGLARYTVQFHNIGAQTVRVTIGRLAKVTVPPNGWRFRDVRFSRPGSYRIVAVAVTGLRSQTVAAVTAQ